MAEYKIISVDISNKQLIEDFLLHAGNSLNKFRYFKSRPVDVVKNHLVTLVALKGNQSVGYAHLDKEKDIVWLGIAIAETEKGKGLGKMLMDKLMEEAQKKNVSKVNLSVDNDNASAIALYEKYNFVLVKKEEYVSFYEKNE